MFNIVLSGASGNNSRSLLKELNMLKPKSIIYIITLLIVSLLAASCADAKSSLLESNENSADDVSDNSEIETEAVESTEDESEDNKEKAIADLVEKYNDLSENDLQYIEDFGVTDKESNH